jgi:pimeloyl-ACP methyl ester carboxylesterase
MSLKRALKATERSLILNGLRAGVRLGALVAPDRTAQAIARRFFLTTRPAAARMQFNGHKPRVDVRKVPDGKVVTYRWGDDDAPTVLLSHGWNGWAQQMEAFVGPLIARGYAVLAIDHVAHGASDGTTSSLPEMIRTVETIFADTPNLVGAIGHSLGAGALAAVLSETRRPLDGAVLIAPPADPRPYLRQLGRMLAAPERLLPAIEQYAEQLAGVPFERLAVQPWTARRIRAPLLVVHDVNDEEVPIADGYAYTNGTQARLLATDGLGHNRILRDRHVVETAVRFAARRSVARRETLAA